MLPVKLSDLIITLKLKTAKLKQKTIDSTFRLFPFYNEGNISKEDNVNFFDIPTTLLLSLETIKKNFDKDFLVRENNLEGIEWREISNF